MDNRKILLVQCCKLPQFFYLAEVLRKQQPNWQIDFLLTDNRHAQFYLRHFGYSQVHFFPSFDGDPSTYGAVLLPLLNRGYSAVKKRAWTIRAKKLQVDYQGNFKDVSYFELLMSILRPTCKPETAFREFLSRFPYPQFGERVLVVESPDSALMRGTASRLESLFPDDAVIRRVVRGTLFRNWKDLRKQKIDSAVVYFSSKKGHFSLRLLPLILRVRDVLVVDENGNFSMGEPLRDLFWPFLHRAALGRRFSYEFPRVLFFQTESLEDSAECLIKLRDKSLFPNARVLLICREEEKSRLEALPGIEATIPWKRGGRFSQARRIWSQTREFQPDLNCASFTGRPVFRLQKLAYFLLGSRKKFAFNASYDAYWMTPRTIHRVFKKEAFQFTPAPPAKVLLLETSSDANMLAALQTVQEPDVVPNARVSIFCREDKARLFGNLPTITYSKKSRMNDLGTLWKLFRMKPDVLAAVFAGAKIYTKHRILFWLLPAHNRLVFNQNLDCFYVDRTTFRLLLGEGSGTPSSLLRQGLRGVLFLPRFLYLLAWRAGWQFGFIRLRRD